MIFWVKIKNYNYVKYPINYLKFIKDKILFNHKI
jgi:hypothetical protein